MKNIKVKKTRRILLISILLILTLIFPQISSAINVGSGTTIEELSRLEEEDYVTGAAESSLFSNQNVFCCQMGQNYYGGGKYKLEHKIIIDASSSNILQGLAYILTNPKTSDSYSQWYYNDKVQIALWGYMNKYQAVLKQYHMEVPSDRVEITNSAVNIYSSSGNIYGGRTGKNEYAYEIYSKALNIANGLNPDGTNKTKTYIGKIFVFTNNKSQNFIIGEGEEQTISPVIKLQLQKTNEEGTGLGSATFKIEGKDNCTFSANLGTGADGKTNIFEIKPTSNTGNIKIDVTELKAPNGYVMLKEITTLNIEYDKVTGIVNGIRPEGNESNYYSSDLLETMAIVKIKNDPNSINLKLIKQDESGQKRLEGVRFAITNCVNIKTEILGNVYVTNANGEIYIPNINLSNPQEFAQITLKEVSNTNEYKSIIGNININITPKQTGYTISASKENTVLDTEFKNNVKVENGNDVIITISNIKNNQMIIKKTDADGNILAGVEFEIELNLVKSLSVNGSEIITYEPTEDSGNDTYTINSKGEISEDASHSGKNYSGKLILKATTDENGLITLSNIKSFIFGDIDMDGTITAVDARLVLRYANELETFTDNQFYLADLNGNGEVDAEESKEFLKMAVELKDKVNVGIYGKITETKPLTGYEKAKDTEFKMTYSNKNKSFSDESISGAGQFEGNSENIKIIGIENYPEEFDLNLIKYNVSSLNPTTMQDVLFEITLENVLKAGEQDATNGKVTVNITTDENGKIIIPNIQPINLNPVKATIKELSNTGCELVGAENGILTLDFNYDETKGWTATEDKQEGKNVIEYNLYNKLLPLDVTILKTDINNQKLSGAKFTITLNNVMGDVVTNTGTHTYNEEEHTCVITDAISSHNDIKIEQIQPMVDANVLITIDEIETPSDNFIEMSDIKFELTREGITWKAVNEEFAGTNEEFNIEEVEIDNENINIKIRNVEKIKICGIVWLDAQTGIKPTYAPNGKYDDGEIGVEGVKVELINDISGEIVSEDNTDSNGVYLFEVVPGKYRVKFNYDGINYQKTIENVATTESIENGREDFNNKFTTIVKDKAIGTLPNGTLSEIPLEYSTEYDNITKMKKSILKTTRNQNGVVDQKVDRDSVGKITKLVMGTTIEHFKMDSTTIGKEYATDTYDINLGLVSRGVDLALLTDLSLAKVSINGKETTYTYDEISKGALENLEIFEKDIPLEDVSYRLSLYNSDYNFRLEDYFNISESLNSKATDEEIKEAKSATDELNVEVTYKVFLNNQSSSEATVNSIVDYYDKNYTFKNAKYVKYNSDGEIEISGNIGIAQEGTTVIDGVEFKKMSITGLDIDKLNGGEQNILYLTFIVGKDDLKNITLGDYGHITEITSYSTRQGYVDKDSAPDNAIIEEKLEKEDDTKNAPNLNVSIKEKERTIEGFVWEDSMKNGAKDTDESNINDVIVQLVELKNITLNGVNYNFEYIWQETTSGNNEATKIKYNATGLETYETSQEAITGQYGFKDYIPGNYIIRFIYGDGTTVTYGMTGNMINYNGQDYKSTIDPTYKEPTYISTNYGTTNSIARDNEARRLYVMSYSTLVDSEKGMLLDLLNEKELANVNETSTDKTIVNKFTYTEQEILKSVYKEIFRIEITELTDGALRKMLQVVLEETWMNADTSTIEVPIEKENDNYVHYENMNFGLALRPTNKLTLEKHVTGVKVSTTGIGASSIVDATKTGVVDETVKLKGLRRGLTAFSSTRTNKNFWKLETDIEELLQGATIQVKYTYTIAQNGEDDYLSQELIEKYKEVNTKLGEEAKYGEFLKELSTSKIQAKGKYVGEYYYTGAVGENDRPTSTMVNTFEDYYEHLKDANSSNTEDLIFDKNAENADGEKVNMDFEIINTSPEAKGVYLINVDDVNREFYINKVIENTEKIKLEESKIAEKTLIASKQLSSLNIKEELDFDSYIAQIVEYSTAVGRRDMDSVPGNLDYIYSENQDIKLNAQNPSTQKPYNEPDEFWAESVTITKPTGEDKTTTTTIILITTSVLAVIAIATIIIKKYIIIKKH